MQVFDIGQIIRPQNLILRGGFSFTVNRYRCADKMQRVGIVARKLDQSRPTSAFISGCAPDDPFAVINGDRSTRDGHTLHKDAFSSGGRRDFDGHVFHGRGDTARKFPIADSRIVKAEGSRRNDQTVSGGACGKLNSARVFRDLDTKLAVGQFGVGC